MSWHASAIRKARLVLQCWVEITFPSCRCWIFGKLLLVRPLTYLVYIKWTIVSKTRGYMNVSTFVIIIKLMYEKPVVRRLHQQRSCAENQTMVDRDEHGRIIGVSLCRQWTQSEPWNTKKRPTFQARSPLLVYGPEFDIKKSFCFL